jgi:glycerol-3-phosphate dehydrogenase
MTHNGPLKLDAVIFGGGAAGLWLLDKLRRHGFSALLLEKNALGCGQTVGSQGILHGGFKYSLKGLLTASATAVADMPQRWRQCLAGRRQPDLSAARLRSDFCYLWRTASLRSRLGFRGARVGLRLRPTALPRPQWPHVLENVGDVMRIDEQVIDPRAFLEALHAHHAAWTLKIDTADGLDVDCRAGGQVESLCLRHPDDGRRLTLRPRWIILTAGEGNAALRKLFCLDPQAMQRRPLHMVLARGDLPTLNGHCTDGARTRVTVTTAVATPGQTVWQIGGQVSEDGVGMELDQLAAHARDELSQAIPGLGFDGLQWASYRVDRAEARTAGNRRPDRECVEHEGNVITAWPTKLVLVPALARRIFEMVGRPCPHSDASADQWTDWPRPDVAPGPWETAARWIDTPADR